MASRLMAQIMDFKVPTIVEKAARGSRTIKRDFSDNKRLHSLIANSLSKNLNEGL